MEGYGIGGMAYLYGYLQTTRETETISDKKRASLWSSTELPLMEHLIGCINRYP